MISFIDWLVIAGVGLLIIACLCCCMQYRRKCLPSRRVYTGRYRPNLATITEETHTDFLLPDNSLFFTIHDKNEIDDDSDDMSNQ